MTPSDLRGHDLIVRPFTPIVKGESHMFFPDLPLRLWSIESLFGNWEAEEPRGIPGSRQKGPAAVMWK